MARIPIRETRAPLSSDLRDFPPLRQRLRRGYPFGGGRLREPSFQKFITHAVLLPESFRGGCSFGLRLRLRPDKSAFAKNSRLPRGIMCCPHGRASRRARASKTILGEAVRESTRPRNPPADLSPLSGGFQPRRSRVRLEKRQRGDSRFWETDAHPQCHSRPTSRRAKRKGREGKGTQVFTARQCERSCKTAERNACDRVRASIPGSPSPRRATLARPGMTVRPTTPATVGSVRGLRCRPAAGLRRGRTPGPRPRHRNARRRRSATPFRRRA